MATDRELSTVLNSGEITNINIGGITAGDKVQVKDDMTGANISFDNTLTSLTATTTQAALAELANVGLAHMHLITPYTVGQTLTTTYAKISAFDTITHNINGAVTPLVDTSEAVPAHLFTINKGGLFNVIGTLTAEFASADTVSLVLYKNGVAVGPPVQVQGRGAGKPVAFAYNDLLTLSTTDYLEIYGKSDGTTNFIVTATSMTVERRPLV